MVKTTFETIDAYLKEQPAESRRVLQEVRKILRKALPKSEETISYSIPALKLDGHVAIFFAGWKHHFAIYPVGKLVPAKLGKELAAYEMHKGTIRFPLDEPLPKKLIAQIAKLRGEETATYWAAKALSEAAKKKTAKKAATKVSTAKKKKVARVAKKRVR